MIWWLIVGFVVGYAVRSWQIRRSNYHANRAMVAMTALSLMLQPSAEKPTESEGAKQEQDRKLQKP